MLWEAPAIISIPPVVAACTNAKRRKPSDVSFRFSSLRKAAAGPSDPFRS